MKYLTFIILALFIFNVSHAQLFELEDENIELPFAEEVQEEVPEEAVVEEEPAAEVEEEVEAEAEAEAVPEEVAEVEEEIEAGGEEVVEEEIEGEAAVEESGEIEVSGGEWQTLPVEAFSNDEFGQQVLSFGSQWIISQLLGYNTIANSSSWNITTVNSVQGQVTEGVNYVINALFNNDAGDAFTANFEINTVRSVGKFEIISVAYVEGDGQAQAAALEEVESEIAVLEEEAQAEAVVEVDTPIIVEANTEPGEEAVVVGGWEALDVEAAQNDANVKNLLDQGVESAIQKGLNEGTLPEGNWALSTVDAIQYQIVAGFNYIFSVTLTDGQNLRAQAAIFVFQGLDMTSSNVVASGFWIVGPPDA